MLSGSTGAKKLVRVVINELTSHKSTCIKKYVPSTHGKLTLYFLPDAVPDLNPDVYGTLTAEGR